MKRPLTPVFVGGAGRCGATTLASVLGSAQNVKRSPREARFFTDHGGLLDLADSVTWCWDPSRASKAVHAWIELIDGLKHGQRETVRKAFREWTGLAAASSKLIKRVCRGRTTRQKGRVVFYEIDPLTDAQMEAHLQSFLNMVFEANETSRYCVDDTSYSILALPRLRLRFPRAEIVWVVRDPCEVALCQSKAKWGANTLEGNAKRVKAFYERMLQARNEVEIVRFEELVRDPKSAIEGLPLKLHGVTYPSFRDYPTEEWKQLPSQNRDLLLRELGTVRQELDY